MSRTKTAATDVQSAPTASTNVQSAPTASDVYPSSSPSSSVAAGEAGADGADGASPAAAEGIRAETVELSTLSTSYVDVQAAAAGAVQGLLAARVVSLEALLQDDVAVDKVARAAARIAIRLDTVLDEELAQASLNG